MTNSYKAMETCMNSYVSNLFFNTQYSAFKAIPNATALHLHIYLLFVVADAHFPSVSCKTL